MPKTIKKEIYKGDRFGLLAVLKEDGKFIQPSGQKQRAFLCLCSCGTETRVRVSHLTSGRVQSCGCLVGESHRMSHSKLYNTWRGMKNRCYGKKYVQAHLYSGRGIKMFERWKNSFGTFRDWAIKNGWSEKLTIDRTNNNGNYTPGNCRFVSQKINCNNRRTTNYLDYGGTRRPIMDVLREKHIESHYYSIRARILRGWSADEAIDTPLKQHYTGHGLRQKSQNTKIK